MDELDLWPSFYKISFTIKSDFDSNVATLGTPGLMIDRLSALSSTSHCFFLLRPVCLKSRGRNAILVPYLQAFVIRWVSPRYTWWISFRSFCLYKWYLFYIYHTKTETDKDVFVKMASFLFCKNFPDHSNKE